MTSITPTETDSTHAHRSIISVGILSDVRFVREALVAIFERSRNLNTIGAAAEVGSAFEAILASRPDIMLIDTALPGGLSVVRIIRQLAPTVRVVALALAEREDEVVAWGESGVAGYIPRSAALNEMVKILEGVMRDEQVCSPRIASGLLRRLGVNPIRLPELPTLTRRELEIVQLINEGLSNKEIARRLKIGLATTKSHVHNALAKLGLGRRSEAAQWVREKAPLLPVRQPSH